MSSTKEILKELKTHAKTKDITVLTADNKYWDIEFLPTGIPPLDNILGGGLPIGLYTELKGEYSSGKSFLASKFIAHAQSLGKTTAYIDLEKSLDPRWQKTIGVDLENLIVPDVTTGEEAFDMLIALVDAGTDLIVFDSLAAVLPVRDFDPKN